MNAPINTRYGVKTFHGKADLIVLNHIENIMGEVAEKTVGIVKRVLHTKIVDYKTVGEVGHALTSAYPKNVYQINMYAWLVEQFLAEWLNMASLGLLEPEEAEHLKLNSGVQVPHIDEVIVDELSIQYMDMSRTRTFSSRGFLYTEGKMLGERGSDGRWHRFIPPIYEELELEPIHHFAPDYVVSLIRKGIEDQVAAEEVLAAPLTGDDARLMCSNCPVRQVCYDTGVREGYDMRDQMPYIVAGMGDDDD
jgi:hypothetical protein